MQTKDFGSVHHSMQMDEHRFVMRRMTSMDFAVTMAKILFSGIAGVDMRGKLNGSVFSKNRGGAYVRTKVTPVNPQSTAQQAQRNNLATWSAAWRGLTEVERQSWIDGAINFPYTDIYGNTKVLSGQQLYVKFNINLANAGGAALDACPSPVALPALESLSLVADDSANTVILTFTPTPVPADFALMVYATGNVTPGKSFVKNLYRFVSVLDPADTSPADISADFVAIHGDPVTGNKIFVRMAFVSLTTGQMGIPLQAQTVVVA